MKKRLVIGVSGASGSVLAVNFLKAIREVGDLESHLVLSRGGALTLTQETALTPDDLCCLADRVYDNGDIGASLASGSFITAGMIVVPCSMKTAAGICSGYSDNLLLRAADVTLKERRPLVLVARESPLSSIHLRNLLELSRMGAVILPPMLSYYHRPLSVEDMTGQVVGRMLDQFGYEYSALRRWEGTTE